MYKRLLLVIPVIAVVFWAYNGVRDGGDANQSASGSDATRAQALLDEGLAAHRAGQIEKATGLYREVLALEPKNKYAYYNLGLIDQLSNRPAEAQANYLAALDIDHAFPQALFNFAILQRDAGKRPQAIDLLYQVTKLEPQNAVAFYNLGLVLQTETRESESLIAFAKARELDPTLVGATTTPGPAATRTPTPTP